MAATRLIAMHINKGKTLAQCLEVRTDYAQNPEKTEKGRASKSFSHFWRQPDMKLSVGSRMR